ncbi:PEP-CTERM sorting domain-containing protein [Aerosakkonemataceae cyanobacterium BLCC-F50]|uniref:PEP-CTERM sorting domain-containing protein n=1 Tax=Floridaenema flaviceps BLCC-F50 TaxID=3153642 RepID=A0ABV4XXA2_9CYAN
MKKSLSALLGSSLLATTVAIASSTLTASPAKALQFTFDNITNNNPDNAAAGESQLFLNVTDAAGTENLSATQAVFKFSNVGSAASSITQIYFDNSSALGSIAGISDSGVGVDFSVATGNLNLPAGNNVNFNEDFGVKANNPVQPMGVNPGEWVSVLFNLNAGQTLQNVFSDLASGALRVGFHVQGFANGGSEAFVNNPPSVTPPPPSASVPEPATMAGLGLVGASLMASRRRKLNKTA